MDGVARLARTAVAIALFLPSHDGMAQEGNPRSRYNLFHRTPPELRRPLTTDRPDRTESPYTVDAGLFQVEADIFSYQRDGSADGQPNVSSSSVNLAPINLKAGLLHNVDFQFVVAPWSWNRSDESGRAIERQKGLGSIAGRLKVNLWGNDGGRTALAVMPFISFLGEPDVRGRTTNFGLIIPFAIDLGDDWGLGMMVQFESVGQRDGQPREGLLITSAAIGRPISGSLSGYAELFSGRLVKNGDAWEATADFGLTLGLGENWQLDSGVNIGLTRDAQDLNPFVGVSFRF